MIDIDDLSTIGDTLWRAAQRYGSLPLLAAPANSSRAYHPDGFEISFAAAVHAVRRLMRVYEEAGYGSGHRVGLLLESRPEHMLHKLALNALGVCCVPVNPDYRTQELIYLIEHSKVDLVVVLAGRVASLEAAIAQATHRPGMAVFEDFGAEPTMRLAGPLAASDGLAVTSSTPASILYTSGTTGRPKGCVLSHRYELASGQAYALRGGIVALREGQERLYNPLPLFHVNASILSFQAVLLTGNCQVQTDRFQASRFWSEVRESRATIVHYLGVIVPMLLNQPASALDRRHAVRFGFGAGVEPQLHAVFEARFGFPLVELWGMTEMVRILCDNHEPRQIGTRAFGRAVEGVEVRVADDADREVPVDAPGEMLIRHSQATPRKDFFSGYLDDPAATEEAWRRGWFHTGDIVRRDASGMLHFVDRRKNIIRRSGENIAAAEVEAWLQTHPAVRQVAVMGVADEVREEEVLACVVLNTPLEDMQDRERMARELFDFCHANLAYFKAPGYVWITDSIPTTGTQKIQKHAIFERGIDPRTLPGMIDLCRFKKQVRPR
jgi:crotonobetaine/carnitine-CoA ligase